MNNRETEKAESRFVWPELPYRGLNYFRPEDRPLLAGRDDDVVACSGLLAHPHTRVLLLHGSTGCGKSSFLRAGLIPVMEDEGAGYLFLKTPGTDSDALFIRCTDAPIDQIARQVFLFASAPFHLRTPGGSRALDLSPALLGASSWRTYLAESREPDALLKSLRTIASIIPQTLVLIVDQAEEVLTLNPSEANFSNRSRFFSFLRDFQKLEFDARILVSLRTEYFGRFIDATQISYRATAEFQQFLLGELPRVALLEAIIRPTRREAIGPFPPPYSKYQFSFRKNVPELIVADILKARYTGPSLPILQLVCLGLHTACVEAGVSEIGEQEYKVRGRVTGLLIKHIADSIRPLYTDDAQFSADLDGIKAFLAYFYSMQDDGSVVARTVDMACPSNSGAAAFRGYRLEARNRDWPTEIL